MPAVAVLSRRRFLASACAAAGVAHTGRLSSRWALLSDTHISVERDAEVRGFTPFEHLQAAVAAIAKEKPDGSVIAGDLARLQGTPADYLQLKAALAPLSGNVPVAFCLGNHDGRENFLAAFGTSAAGVRPGVGEW